MPERLRFAPSNTGHLHIGGARTALYNWLIARQTGGKFILRVENTDLERSKDEYTSEILESLKWLGLDWDEGPEFQTQRAAQGLYKPFIDKLIANQSVYRCFCDKDRLEKISEFQKSKKDILGYDGKCRELPQTEADALAASGSPYVYRIRVVRPGKTEWQDGIQRNVIWNNRDLSDEVIIRSDGSPMYNLVVVCDDISMGITHVIRGADHSANTPKQLQIYHALGAKPPKFSHIPLIFGPDGKKLSKRNPSIFQGKPVMSEVQQYRKAGYLPGAMLNYLVLLGWGFDGVSEVFSKDDLIAKFDLSRVSSGPARFDPKKLEHFQGIYVRNLSDDKFEKIYMEYLIQANLVAQKPSEEEIRKVKALVKLEKGRTRAFAEIPAKAQSVFSRDTVFEPGMREILNSPMLEFFSAYSLELQNKNFEDPLELENHARGFATNNNLKFPDFVHPLRVAITGVASGPKLFEIMRILGKELTLHRIKTSQNGNNCGNS